MKRRAWNHVFLRFPVQFLERCALGKRMPQNLRPRIQEKGKIAKEIGKGDDSSLL